MCLLFVPLSYTVEIGGKKERAEEDGGDDGKEEKGGHVSSHAWKRSCTAAPFLYKRKPRDSRVVGKSLSGEQKIPSVLNYA